MSNETGNPSKRRILRLKEVIQCTGLSRASIYRLVADGAFPLPISLGTRSTGWHEAEVDEWCATRPRKALARAEEASE
jgi:prophage regulatory protein